MEQRFVSLDLDNPWPLVDVIKKLVSASEILLIDKNYDGHGWEEISHCVERGKEIISQIESEKQ